jgi:hypothetical protein
VEGFPQEAAIEGILQLLQAEARFFVSAVNNINIHHHKKACYEKHIVFSSRYPYYWMVIRIFRLQCHRIDPYFTGTGSCVYSAEFYPQWRSVRRIRNYELRIKI